MDGMRRSFDRSREFVPKKPRLTEELGTRPFALRPGAPVVTPAQPRFKLSDREVDGNDPASEAYQPQPLPQHQQHQELVEQYRTALAELTFNSKPIITNLTIIAGENLHAAKAIAATVCANIIEVPSDQKLPSLYLLDSIVKNIGRDYIKYFAAKLPEVFCKAYRQVDPSVHSAMRHLFGTWKGVFHYQTLQYIERQLGFVSTGNGTLASTTSRSDSQSQRPAHSIHVNPKYLERQRLQQSSGAKANDVAGALASSSEDLDRLDGATGVSGGHTWENPPVKTQSIQRLHRDPLGEAVQDKSIGVNYGNYDYGSDTSRSAALGAGRITGKISEQGLSKPWYGTGGSVAQSPSSQRNGFSGKHGFSSYQPKSTSVDSHLQPSHGITNRSGGISSSWKNSEEEEFMWDSVDPRSMERDINNIPSISRKDHWTLDGSEEMGSISNLAKPLSKDGLMHTGTSNNLGVSEGYPGRVGGLSSSMSSFSRREVGSEMRSPNIKQIGPGFSPSTASSGITGSQRIQSLGSASPSGRSLAYQHSLSTSDTRLAHQKLQNLPEQNYPRAQMLPRTEFKTAHLPEKSSVGSNNLHNPDSLSKFRLKELKPSPPHTIPLQTRHHRPQLQQARSEPAMPEILGQNKKPLLSQVSERDASSASETSGQLSKSRLLAADIEGGAVSIDAAIGTSLSAVGPRSMPSRVCTKPTSLTGPPPIDLVSSDLGASLSTLLASRHDDSSISRDASQVKVGLPPVPPGPPTVVDNAADRSSSAVETTSNPVSSLLSTLVAKGLISTSKPESTSASSQMHMKVQNEAKDNLAAGFGPDSSASVSIAMPVSSTEDDVPIAEQVTKSSAPPLPHSPREIKNLIGFEFKPSVVREFSESVISELFEDFPHRCGICGVQLKFQDHLDQHLAWHDSKDPESRGLLSPSRGWYPNLTDWVDRKGYLPCESEHFGSEEKSGETTEMHGPMVPADESQCACILCGELFDDVYSLERDEWMFKGAVHMDIPPASGTMMSIKNQSSPQGPIVHASCISESSPQDLGLANDVKLEKDA
ncbi:hypothetical protein J3R85_000559 [Psidium guajava]|nr:hypothetical protein J3R85_000559 [Psidium guajava]